MYKYSVVIDINDNNDAGLYCYLYNVYSKWLDKNGITKYIMSDATKNGRTFLFFNFCDESDATAFKLAFL